MPKQIHKIDQFHGGLNSNSDPRDIADNELSAATDVMVDEVGRVRTLGGTADHSSDDGSPTVDIEPGYGLFKFSHDMDNAQDGTGTASSNPPNETDYLALADNTSEDHSVWIYSDYDNDWSDVKVISMGDGTHNFKPCFYNVDGALRVSDGNFDSSAVSQWYGYIKKIWFPNVEGGYSINEWYGSSQMPQAPGDSYYKKDWGGLDILTESSSAVPEGASWNWDSSGEPSPTGNILRTDLVDDFVDGGAVYRCSASFMFNTGFGMGVWPETVVIRLRFRCGFWNDNGDSGALTNAELGLWAEADENKSWKEVLWEDVTVTHGETISEEFYFDSAYTLVNENNPGGSGSDYFRIAVMGYEITSSGNIFAMTVMNSPIFEVGSLLLPDMHDDGTDFTNGYTTGNNVCMLWDWDILTEGAAATSWVPEDNSGLWGIGATFIYDGLQETKLTVLKDEDDQSEDGMNLYNLGDSPYLNTANRPAVLLVIADPNDDITPNDWNKRVTGCNIYLKNLYAAGEGDSPNAWILQYSANFLTGKLMVESTKSEYDVAKNLSDDQDYYYWYLPATHSNTPSATTTYEANTGYSSNSEDFVSQYKTAAVSNRTVYVGNLKILKSDNTEEIMGDAMVKSNVGKFDSFPMSRIIEASVRDGDNIIKLEEYADRILQFKKDKMHIINVSQELEFLEETFVRKGVSHPSATCKTDFGIAWVNNHGVYFYDGQKVNNLFEKQGVQIIKESDWDSWFSTNDEPMIGYVPKKRQLIIKNNISSNSTNDNDIYLFDMVTRSWIRGTNAFPSVSTSVNVNATNPITDWDGDLIIGYGYTSINIQEWDDTSDSTDNYELRTKDIDFGHPGQRKKVSKVRISYKGDASNLQVGYSVDGSQSLDYEFNSNLKPLTETTTTDWIHAELTPTTSSLASNIYSFQLHFLGSAGADFEINDISIVYRLKPVK